MKKFLAILLAMTLILANVAFALAGGDVPAEPAPVTPVDTGTPASNAAPAATTPATAQDPSVDTGYDADTAPKAGLANGVTVEINKHFNVTGATAQVPAQTITFKATAGTTQPTGLAIPAIADFSVSFTEGQTSKAVNLVLPAYPDAGIYNYTLEEVNTNIAGQKYASDLTLKVTVINGEEGLVIAGVALRQGDVKTDTLENDYAAHDLTVGKTVEGNMGKKDKLFPITVILTAPDDDKVFGTVGVTITGNTATVKEGETPITTQIAPVDGGWTTKTLKLQLADGQNVKFDNLPEGVTYTVVEDPAIIHLTDATLQPENPEAYKVDGQVESATALTADATTVTITNTKTMEVDTGITVESLPYMLILAIALVGAAMLIARRREEY